MVSRSLFQRSISKYCSIFRFSKGNGLAKNCLGSHLDVTFQVCRTLLNQPEATLHKARCQAPPPPRRSLGKALQNVTRGIKISKYPMSLESFTMTSVSGGGLKPPPPLATSKFPTNNRENVARSVNHNSPKAATMPSPRKSVEFVLHAPPSKRTKLDTAWSAKQVVDGEW